MSEEISIIKTKDDFLSILGLRKPKSKEVFRISEKSLFYNSKLGKLGQLYWHDIKFIEQGKTGDCEIIKIGLKEEFDLDSKLTQFYSKLSKLYKKKTGAEILIFPQDIDIKLDELFYYLKRNYGW